MIIQGNDTGQKPPELIPIQLTEVNMTEGITLLFGTAPFFSFLHVVLNIGKEREMPVEGLPAIAALVYFELYVMALKKSSSSL